MEEQKRELEVDKDGRDFCDDVCRERDKESALRYIWERKHEIYKVLFEVHMDTWIIDILDMDEAYKEYFEDTMYYGKYVEIMEQQLVYPEDVPLVYRFFSISKIMHEITQKKVPFLFSIRCRYYETYHWFQFSFAYEASQEGAGRLIVQQKDCGEVTEERKLTFEDIKHSVLDNNQNKLNFWETGRSQNLLQLIQSTYSCILLISVKDGSYHFIDLEKEKGTKVVSGKNFDEIEKDRQLVKWRSVLTEIRKSISIKDINRYFQEMMIEMGKTIVKVKNAGKESWYENKVLFWYAPDKMTCMMLRDVTNERQAVSMAKVQNDILKKSLLDMRKAEYIKNMFFSNMSIDVKSQIYAIADMTDKTLAETTDNTAMKECLERISAVSHNVMSEADYIFDMSQISGEGLTLEIEEVHLSDILQGIEGFIRRKCNEKGIRFKVQKVGIVHDSVKVDGRFLRQVMLLMLMNAICVTSENGQIIFEVQEQRTFGFTSSNYIFHIISESFAVLLKQKEQLDNIFSDKDEKCEWGLTVARHIMDQLGGEITVEKESEERIVATISCKMQIEKR